MSEKSAVAIFDEIISNDIEIFETIVGLKEEGTDASKKEASTVVSSLTNEQKLVLEEYENALKKISRNEKRLLIASTASLAITLAKVLIKGTAALSDNEILMKAAKLAAVALSSVELSLIYTTQKENNELREKFRISE